MASISCFCALFRQPTLRYLLASSNDKASSFDNKIMPKHSASHVCPVSISSSIDQPCVSPSRRELIILPALAAFTFPPTLPHAFADSDVDRMYTDDVNKFKIAIPQEWQVGTGEPNGYKSITAFYPQEDSNSNVSVVITLLGPDFTRMESFGKVDEFAETLVSGLDRSWQRPPGVAAKLIDCKASKGLYYINYSLQNPGEARRYLYSAIGMASNGWYNRLYTVTGQFVENDANKYGSQIQKVVASFRFI
ncbi:hypothetical protein K1719_021822 [Acacia pycnantha]|nr:hypothetical protein K1719_021822 [Acacia pycnantha]